MTQESSLRTNLQLLERGLDGAMVCCEPKIQNKLWPKKPSEQAKRHCMKRVLERDSVPFRNGAVILPRNVAPKSGNADNKERSLAV